MLKNKNYIVSLGINDYRNCLGGTNKVILEQESLLRKNDISYLYICPVKRYENKVFWEVIADNKFYKILLTENLMHLISTLAEDGYHPLEFHIHNFARVEVQDLNVILRNINLDIKFFLHDYYTICPKYMKNINCDIDNENICKICRFSIKKVIEISEFFNRNKCIIKVIVPSKDAKQKWLKYYPEYINNIILIPHQKISILEDISSLTNTKQKIKISYLGEKITYKGWDVWNIVINHITSSYINFYYIGTSVNRHFKYENIKVDFRSDMNSTVNALKLNKIDCVILWSLVPETYSFTYYECLAANVFVITNVRSGNIMKQIEEHGNGIILLSVDDLLKLLRDIPKLEKLINNFKDKKKYIQLSENEELINYISQSKTEVCNKYNKKNTWLEIYLNLVFYLKQYIYMIKR